MKKKVDLKISEKKRIELDIVCKSLIGREIEIVDSLNPSLVGMRGVLVYESAKLFYVQTGDIVKRVLKSAVTIRFDYDSEKVVVRGEALLGTLVQRIKKIK